MFLSRPPRHPHLVGLVDRLWWAAPQPGGEVQVEWVLPTCRSQLILSPAGSVFVGPKVRAERIERRTDATVVGVSLVAGTESAFVESRGRETRGLTISLDAVMSLGSLADRLAERNGTEAIDLAETELVAWLSPAPLVPAVLAAERAVRSGARSTNIAASLGVDRRKLVPEFRQMVGVTPKHYERICRFNRTVAAARTPDAAPLATIAAVQGFSDQAHLTREIVHFAQTRPSLIHRDGTGMVNHVASDKIFKT